MNDSLFEFVKEKMEEGEGISPDALSRLKDAAQREIRTSRHIGRRVPYLLAASLSVVVCGWFFLSDARNTQRESEIENVISLLRIADGTAPTDAASLADNILAWQDEPIVSAE